MHFFSVLWNSICLSNTAYETPLTSNESRSIKLPNLNIWRSLYSRSFSARSLLFSLISLRLADSSCLASACCFLRFAISISSSRLRAIKLSSYCLVNKTEFVKSFGRKNPLQSSSVSNFFLRSATICSFSSPPSWSSELILLILLSRVYCRTLCQLA